MAGHLCAHPAGVLAGVMQRPGHRGRQHRGQRQERLRRCGGGRRQSEEVVTDLKMLMFCHHLSVRTAGWLTSAGGALSWAGVIPGTPSMPRLLGPAPLLLLLLWDLPHLKWSRVSIIWMGWREEWEKRVNTDLIVTLLPQMVSLLNVASAAFSAAPRVVNWTNAHPTNKHDN